MPVLGRRRRTVRTRDKMLVSLYIPSRGTVRVVCKPAAEDACADILVRFQAKQLQMLRERDLREFEKPQNVLARNQRAVLLAELEEVIQELRDEKRKVCVLLHTERRKQRTAESKVREKVQAEKRKHLAPLLALQRQHKKHQAMLLTALAAAQETPALCADVPVEERQERPAALAATERITATCATLAAKDRIPLFCAVEQKLRKAFKQNGLPANLTELPLEERAQKVRDFFQSAGVNGPVDINVRNSLQNNGDSGKGGFLAGDSACAAGTVLGLMLPSTMRIDEPSTCMGEPWEDGVQQESGQLLGGVFNTEMQAGDQQINAVICTIGRAKTPNVHIAAVILIKRILPGQEIVLQYNNKAPPQHNAP
tara:strand:- start:67 stop:1170 length:1104 start_codon:yes stop_codon:yes gene_type:complete